MIIVLSRPVWAKIRNQLPTLRSEHPFLDLSQKTLHVSHCIFTTGPFLNATGRLLRRIQSIWDDVELCRRARMVGLHRSRGNTTLPCETAEILVVYSGNVQTGLT